jgi:hypothetical protein
MSGDSCFARSVPRQHEDGTPIDAGKGKSHDFRLSQALANPVVKKGFSAAAASE